MKVLRAAHEKERSAGSVLWGRTGCAGECRQRELFPALCCDRLGEESRRNELCKISTGRGQGAACPLGGVPPKAPRSAGGDCLSADAGTCLSQAVARWPWLFLHPRSSHLFSFLGLSLSSSSAAPAARSPEPGAPACPWASTPRCCPSGEPGCSAGGRLHAVLGS